MAISSQALDVLRRLKECKNVLVSAPPACGKTRLIQEVADAFANPAAFITPPAATLSTATRVPIPARIPTGQGGNTTDYPSATRYQRHVERIAFSANTKARDFTSAFVPSVNGSGFRVASGVLVKANSAALGGKAALLVIDEMNRGPAVQLFGDAIVAIEADKRLDVNDALGTMSWPMQILTEAGATEGVYLSSHLYILAAMNQADVSVEPMDLAFLRRFEPYRLMPDATYPRTLLGAAGPTAVLPDLPATPGDVVEAVVRAWEYANSKIALGRGEDFQIGHGVFLSDPTPPTTVADALGRAVTWWKQIVAHVREAFYSDLIGMGIALRAGDNPAGYRIMDTPYGLDQRQHLIEPPEGPNSIYATLKIVASV
jgi:5-methylcytosine-specific restriction protein B